MHFHVVIPARYASSRLSGKPLCDVNGKALVHRVYDVAVASGATEVVVATDDERIVAYCEANALPVLLTCTSHQSGTDRCAEVARTRQWPADDIVVNLQGDEPLVPAAYLLTAAQYVGAYDLSTLAAPLATSEGSNPNRVKVVRDARGGALYFSRAPIPFDRDGRGNPAQVPLHHIGIYAYRVRALDRLSELAPCPLEQTESLEQLRALYHGFTIRVARVDAPPGPGVDTPDDLARVRAVLAAR